VADNIRYAAPDVTDAEMLEMARKIGDGEWLETLPNGIQTEVGERGGSLSMGQRQLVALMRVLMQKPAIFILDEATASIDPFTEWQIQQALNLILKNSTSILIAHRLSTVKAADRIVVMEKGAIIEEGNHDRPARRRSLRDAVQHVFQASKPGVYGLLIKERRYLRRAVFIVDREGRLTYVNYLPVLGQEPDYDEVIAEARKALG
jgi:ABC-type bacteriocin/lantibiotic exporter with double-glycine peptidase domain